MRSVAALTESQWIPRSANQWTTRSGEDPVLGVSPSADAAISRAYKREPYAIKWRKAANHFTGDGLTEGEPSWHGTDSAMKCFDEMGRQDLKSALRKIVAGGVAAGERLARNTGCNQCGCPVETPKHRWYICGKF